MKTLELHYPIIQFFITKDIITCNTGCSCFKGGEGARMWAKNEDMPVSSFLKKGVVAEADQKAGRGGGSFAA